MPRPRPYKPTPYKSPYKPSYQASSRPARPPAMFRAGGGEMKYFDTERSQQSIAQNNDWTGTECPPNVGTPNTLVVPTVGSAINQRIGRRIKLYKIRVRGLIYTSNEVNQTAGDEQPVIRVALVQDMQTNATQAQGEQIFQAPTTASSFQCLNSFQSLDTLGRFKVWKDKIITSPQRSMAFDGTNIEVEGFTRHFKMNLVFKKPIEINFNATNGGTISDIVDNSFCIYAQTLAGGALPVMTYQCRAYYKE